MTTRYENHDMEDVPAPLTLVPPDHTTPGGDNESSNKYSELTLSIPWLSC